MLLVLSRRGRWAFLFGELVRGRGRRALRRFWLLLLRRGVLWRSAGRGGLRIFLSLRGLLGRLWRGWLGLILRWSSFGGRLRLGWFLTGRLVSDAVGISDRQWRRAAAHVTRSGDTQQRAQCEYAGQIHTGFCDALGETYRLGFYACLGKSANPGKRVAMKRDALRSPQGLSFGKLRAGPRDGRRDPSAVHSAGCRHYTPRAATSRIASREDSARGSRRRKVVPFPSAVSKSTEP